MFNDIEDILKIEENFEIICFIKSLGFYIVGIVGFYN